jgi:hypothetical protein
MKKTMAVILTVLMLLYAFSAFAEEVAAVNQWCVEIIGAGDITASSVDSASEEAGTAEIKIALIDSGIRKNDLRIDKDKILDGKNYVFEGPAPMICWGTALLWQVLYWELPLKT